MDPLPHLSDAALEHVADVGRFGQDVGGGDPPQEHVCVDVEALGFPRRRLPLQGPPVHLQDPRPLDALRHHAMPLAQRHRGRAEQDRLAWGGDGLEHM